MKSLMSRNRPRMASTERPAPHQGLRHVALFVAAFEACERFYVDVLGMAVEWRPDADNLYLCSGTDNLALHRRQGALGPGQRLDHIGFILARADDVDAWHAWVCQHGIEVAQPPRTHRDGARSFYCRDPDGTLVQMIHHPPISG